jgi:hypothetical protein
MRYFAALLLFCISGHFSAQVFIDVALSQGIVFTYYGEEYGGGVSFVDYDKDGWDDLSFCQFADNARFYRNNNGQFEDAQFFFSNTGQLKHILWVDYDNDNDLDIYATRMWETSSLYENDGNMNFTDVTISAGLFTTEEYMTTGASFGDYDRDGDLDLYLCNYNGPGFSYPYITNYLFRNNGDGTFTDVTAFAGVGNGNRYSFQGLWTDYNHDLWPDLLVINDRIEASNYLYRNNGDGTFSDVSAQSGIGGYNIFSMNASGDDYDNDGDLDVYITNNPTGNLLHRNNGNGTFSEVALSAGVKVFDHTWCAQFFDYDNDTHLDLHVCCSPFWGNPGQNKFFKNNGDGTFNDHIAAAGFNGDQGFSHSSAVGDFNNDGHFDLAISKAAPNLSKLFQCPTSNNSWLKVKLQGTVSNRDGIGSWIELYANNKEYVRYTYCGEGYLCQNSHSEIFGLGSNTSIDSLIVTWPSGLVDSWYNVSVNQNLVLEEGSSYVATINVQGDTDLCAGESVLLLAPQSTSYLWNNQSNANFLLVTEPGEYWCTVVSEWGLEYQTDVVTVTYAPELQLEVLSSNPSCTGYSDGEISLLSNEIDIVEVQWSNENTGAFISDLVAGTYSYSLIDEFGCSEQGSVEIGEPVPLELSLNAINNLCYGDFNGSGEIEIVGGSEPYSISWSNGDGTNLPNGEYTVQVEDNHGCIVSQEFEISSPTEIEITVIAQEASAAFGNGSAEAFVSGGVPPPYDIIWSNGSEGSSIEELTEGFYACVVIDSNGCQLESIFQIVYNGIEEENGSDITIFPNPCNDWLELVSEIPMTSLWITNSMGQSVKEITNLDSKTILQVDTKSLPSGVYYLTTKGPDNLLIFMGRFVKVYE